MREMKKILRSEDDEDEGEVEGHEAYQPGGTQGEDDPAH